jgi:hypothetical protein
MTDKYKWGAVELLPDGHRLFPELEGDRIAIADNSGREPQDTDDGVLWLDFEWNLMICAPDDVLSIPVKRARDGERFSTVTDLTTLMHLAAEYEWPVEDQFARSNTLYSVTKEGK